MEFLSLGSFLFKLKAFCKFHFIINIGNLTNPKMSSLELRIDSFTYFTLMTHTIIYFIISHFVLGYSVVP